MSCIWQLFTRKRDKKSSSTRILIDEKHENPICISNIPDTIPELKIVEGALISNLVTLHYSLEETKKQIAVQAGDTPSKRLLDLLAKRRHLSERKLYFEQQLKKVQIKLKAS